MTRQPERSAELSEETPAVRTYREIASEHADRLYGLAVLLLGERDVAQSANAEAFRRMWNALDRGEVIGDVEETLYRFVTRAALQRLAKSRELRGFQPATTVDDRQITAAGIVGNFSPQQRAAVYAVAWGKLGYRLAGIASGVGEARAKDLVFSARQEYREARGGPEDAEPVCREMAPLLSTRADGQLGADQSAQVEEHLARCPVCQHTAMLYEEFAAMLREMRLPRATGSPEDAALEQMNTARARRRFPQLRVLLRLAAGPGILVVVLIAGLFLFGPCGEASVRTGAGRTSDLLYAREGSSGAILVLESGSGRELSRLPAGVLTREGTRVYSTVAQCGASGCATTLRATDTATRESSDVGRLEGRLTALAVDEANRIYLADEDAGWQRLVISNPQSRAVASAVTAPEGVTEAFSPQRSTMTDDGRLLFTLGLGENRTERLLVRTELNGAPSAAAIAVPFPGGSEPAVLARSSSGPVFVYQFTTGMLYEVDPVRRALIRSTQLEARGEPAGTPDPALAVTPDGKTLYAALPGGGIGVVSLESDGLMLAGRYVPDRPVNAISLSSDGRTLYAVSGPTYLVLNAATGEQLVRREGARAIAFLQVNAGE